MKYIFFLLSLSLVVLASGGTSATIISGSSNRALDGLFQSIIDSIENAAKEGTNTAEIFTESVQNATAQFVKEAEAYAESIGEAVRSYVQLSLDAFQASVRAFHVNLLAQINIVNNRVKQHLLREVDNVLQLVDERINALPQLLRDVHAKTQQGAQNARDNQLRQWQSWASQQLQLIALASGGNQTTLQAAKDIVNEYINHYVYFLDGCNDEVEARVDDFDDSVQQVIEKYQPILEQLVSNIQDSLEIDDDQSAQIRNNVITTRKQYQLLRDVAVDAVNLTKQGQRLLQVRFDQSVCAVQTRNQFEQGKFSVQQRLLRLVRQQKLDEENASN